MHNVYSKSTGAKEILQPETTYGENVTCFSIPLSRVLAEIINNGKLLIIYLFPYSSYY